jgi:hypothetical protein
MGLSLNVQIPESLQQALELAGYSAESLGVEARRALAASLYARRVLTLTQAAQLAQMPVREFLRSSRAWDCLPLTIRPASSIMMSNLSDGRFKKSRGGC